MTDMRQFVPVSGRFIGEPPNTDRNYVSWCPKCGRRIPDNDCTRGYGRAFGNGCGWYVYCCNPKCDWFYKELEGDSDGLSKPGIDGSRG